MIYKLILIDKIDSTISADPIIEFSSFHLRTSFRMTEHFCVWLACSFTIRHEAGVDNKSLNNSPAYLVLGLYYFQFNLT